ncbi:MAG: hypothetical protein Q4B32_08905 [Clostridia bacterium]|nr:hypothetical protein [Clostridia bacterium]
MNKQTPAKHTIALQAFFAAGGFAVVPLNSIEQLTTSGYNFLLFLLLPEGFPVALWTPSAVALQA